MWNFIHKIKMEEMYYFLLVVYICNQVLSESQYIKIPLMSIIFIIVRYFVIFSLIFFVKREKIRSKIIYIFGILLLFISLNFILVDGGISYVPVILFTISSKNYSLEKIFKYSLYSLILSHVIVILGVLFGILHDTIDFRYIGSFSGSILSGAYYRHNLGFLVHNQIPIAYFIIYLYIIVIRRNKITIIENILYLIFNYLIFKYCGSRVVFILLLVAIILFVFIKNQKKFHIKLKHWYLMYVYLLAALFSIITAFLYKNNNLWNTIDMIFNNRISMASKAVNYYGISLIGSGKDSVLYSASSLIDITIDNGYINLLIGDGLIIFILILGIWMYITFIIQKKGNRYILLVLFLLAIENLINSHLGSFKLIPFFCILINQNDPFLKPNYNSDKINNAVSKRFKLKI